MPDLIRHSDIVPTKVGNHFKDWVPVFTRMTILNEGAIYKQTLNRKPASNSTVFDPKIP
jgi:hypothetical protein